MIVPYEEELNKIAHIDDSIDPEVLRDASGIIKQKTANKHTVRDRTKENMQLKIAKFKEEQKEKRHQERLALLRKILEDKKRRHDELLDILKKT
ncbi:hypothetical protein QE152_g8431 [Popillia japonica]|uniref:Uncharacterized protein n=1 Tax=Popillia japonica TaxID=7064 RepID=A0AAW1M943_POPJA